MLTQTTEAELFIPDHWHTATGTRSHCSIFRHIINSWLRDGIDSGVGDVGDGGSGLRVPPCVIKQREVGDRTEEEEDAEAQWKPTDEGAAKSEAHAEKLLKY